MLVASKLNMRGIEKESEKEPKQPIFCENIRHFLRKTCTQKVSRCGRATTTVKKSTKKSTLHVQY